MPWDELLLWFNQAREVDRETWGLFRRRDET